MSGKPNVKIQVPPEPAAQSRGEDIRARIEANRRKRLAISDAMKAEAGVTGHEINREGFGGLAYIGTGRIVSPEGQNMRQLYVVAHECGHIFLHNAPPGLELAAHVMEMEAESYAHQAFREHGMELARHLSDWGRQYVGEWIAKDRIAGYAIDPRAEAYARGTRSPYEPLRMVPGTWRLHRAEASASGSVAAPAAAAERVRPKRPRVIAAEVPRGGIGAELRHVLARVCRGLVDGAVLGLVGLNLIHGFYHPLPDYFAGPYSDIQWPLLPVLLASGLVFANLSVMWRTMTR